MNFGATWLRMIVLALLVSSVVTSLVSGPVSAGASCEQRRASAGRVVTAESVNAVVARLLASGRTDADVERVLLADYCLAKVGSGGDVGPASSNADATFYQKSFFYDAR